MHSLAERGVPLEERLKANISGLSDWDAARIFLEVVRCGSFRSAAERLSLSINAVRRRIDDFERQTGTTLFTRDVHGTHLTDEGAMVVSAVERMEAAAFDVLRTSDSTANVLSGEVRVAVTEGLGTFWLARGWSNSSRPIRRSWSTCIARCARPTSPATRPTSQSICRVPLRSTSSWCGSAACI